MKKKKKDGELKFPSLFKRVRPTLIYNALLSAIFLPLFPILYSLDDVAYELDYFLMYGILELRWQLITTLICFYFFLRQIFKDLNLLILTLQAHRHDKDIIEFGGHKRLTDGIEGIGKTMNVSNDAVILAANADEKMRFEYYLNKPFSDVLAGDKHFKVLCESFDFFKEHPERIPHLMANYKIEYDKKESYPFDIAYFKQEKRPAEGFTLALTELADELPNSWSKMPKDESKDDHKIIKMNETLSKSRQWFDLTIISDEQRMGEVFIGFRSTTGLGRSLISRQRVLKPKFLRLIEDFLHKRILKRKEKTSRFLSRFYSLIHKIADSIGFFEFTFVDRDVLTSKGKTEEQTFILPCKFLFKYDTRGERDKYPLYCQKPL